MNNDSINNGPHVDSIGGGDSSINITDNLETPNEQGNTAYNDELRHVSPHEENVALYNRGQSSSHQEPIQQPLQPNQNGPSRQIVPVDSSWTKYSEVQKVFQFTTQPRFDINLLADSHPIDYYKSFVTVELIIGF